MSLRHVVKTVAGSLAAISVAGSISLAGFAVVAGASGPGNGTIVPGADAAVAPFTAGIPFSSGQSINVVIPANSNLSPTTNLNVVECSAPGGVIPTDPSTCDGNTINGPTLKPNADGSVNFQTFTHSLYQVYALPDSITLGETSGPACDLTTECILYIGQNQNDFTQPHYWSPPFFIAPNASDDGSNPGDGSAPAVATTSTALVASPTSSVFGQSVALTATVSTNVPGSCTPSGPVTFANGSTTLGTGTLSGGQATLSTSALPVGTASLTASFPGSTGCPASASTASSFAVSKASTTTALTGSPAGGSVSGQAVTFTATVSPVAPGAGSPTGTVTFKDGTTTIGTAQTLNGSGQASVTTSSLAGGSHSITAASSGDANFTASTGSLTYSVGLTSTTTALAATPASGSVSGQSVTFTATVAPVAPATATPTGAVTFKDGTTTIGTAQTLNGSGQASVTTSSLMVASHTITATYGGSTTDNGSSGTLTYAVSAASTTTSLVAAPTGSSVSGQPVVFTATVAPVAPGAGPPSGTVTFKDGTTALGTGTLSSGSATFSTSSLAVGTHSITASYGADPNFSASTSSALSYAVNPAGTASALTSSITPSTPGQSVTFTDKVTVTAPGTGTPSGSVTFEDGTASIGTGTLTSGTATLTTSTLALGSHPISAVYAQTGAFAGSTSNTVAQVVALVSSSTTLASSLNPSAPAQAVTFTATVTASAGTATGTVTFNDGTTSIGTGTLNGSGQATLTTSALAIGTHPITAVYGGTSAIGGSTSAVLNQVVALVHSTTTLTSSVNPSAPAQAVTFTATVTAASGAIPTGTVTFNNGTTSIGTGTLNGSGQATLTTSTLALGTHPITAVYSATASIGGSTSTTVNQVVALVTSTTTLASSVNPSAPAQAVTFTATVTASSGTATGTVTFNDGTTALGTGTLNAAGQATLTTSALAIGTHPVTAVYGGTASVGGSTSAVLNQVVASVATATVVTSSVNPSGPGQSVTFTAKVTASSGATPTGTATFMDGTTALGTGTLNAAGETTFATSTLAIGTHPITAVYGGGGPDLGSTSAVLNQVVTRLKTVLTASPQVSLLPASNIVPNVKAVLAASAGLPVPGKSITFKVGNTVLCTAVTNASGVATCKPAGDGELLLLLANGYTATFAGDAMFLPSTGKAPFFVV